jgi:signal transduction histidine kinase
MRAPRLSLFLRPAAPCWKLGLLVATVFAAVETLVVLWLKHIASNNAFGVIYLLGVLVVSIGWGRGLSATTAVANAMAFNYFRGGPAGSGPITIQNAIAVIVFLAVALSANTLASLARSRAGEADQGRREANLAAELAQMVVEQQTAVRRVATLVARGLPVSEVFSAALEGMGQVLDIDRAWVVRYEPDGAATVVASLDVAGPVTMHVGEASSLDADGIAAVMFRTGRPARSGNLVGEDCATVVAPLREPSPHSSVGAPIVVNCGLWGAAIVGTLRRKPLAPDTETRLADYTDLLATAVGNARVRAELTASRARLVAAGDDARRRLERDLHDGAQQRLVAMGLELRAVEASVPNDLHPLKQQISEVNTLLVGVAQDLHEISRGIYPTILSQGGLGPALKALARRSVVPAELDLAIDHGLPEFAAVAAYYVVAEALTNTAKHARASQVTVHVHTHGARLCLVICDDGIGGAATSAGSGLVGLIDRVEALGGHLEISSPVGHGTSLLVEIPFETAEIPFE